MRVDFPAACFTAACSRDDERHADCSDECRGRSSEGTVMPGCAGGAEHPLGYDKQPYVVCHCLRCWIGYCSAQVDV